MNERSFTGGRIMKDNPAVDKREQILVAAEQLIDDLVSFAFKELEERVTNLVSAHVHAALPENCRVRILPYCRFLL